jgi:hypothetical protein
MKFRVLERFDGGQVIYGATVGDRSYIIAFDSGKWTASFKDPDVDKLCMLIDWNNAVSSYETAKQACERHARQ